MENYSAYWQEQQQKLGLAVPTPQKAIKQPKTAVEVEKEDGSQFPRIIEQENSAL